MVMSILRTTQASIKVFPTWE